MLFRVLRYVTAGCDFAILGMQSCALPASGTTGSAVVGSIVLPNPDLRNGYTYMFLDTSNTPSTIRQLIHVRCRSSIARIVGNCTGILNDRKKAYQFYWVWLTGLAYWEHITAVTTSTVFPLIQVGGSQRKSRPTHKTLPSSTTDHRGSNFSAKPHTHDHNP